MSSSAQPPAVADSLAPDLEPSADTGMADAFAPEPELDIESLRAAVLRQIRHLVDFYRITPEELSGPWNPSETTETPPQPAPIKYRHPVSGLTWDGQGTQPDWLRQALLQEGYRVAELKVDPQN